MPEPHQHSAGDAEVTKLIGTKCYVNWPYLVEAIVVGASDASCKYFSPQHVYNKNDPSKSYNNPVNTATTANGESTQTPPSSSPPPAEAPSPVVPDIRSVPNTAEATGYFKKV